MNITTKIELPIKVKRGKGKNPTHLAVGSLPALNIIMGTTSAAGNLHIYGITKDKNTFKVPVEVFRERIEILKQREKQLQDKIKIMEEIWHQI